jgi:hypothetical protein
MADQLASLGYPDLLLTDLDTQHVADLLGRVDELIITN